MMVFQRLIKKLKEDTVFYNFLSFKLLYSFGAMLRPFKFTYIFGEPKKVTPLPLYNIFAYWYVLYHIEYLETKN